MSETPGLKATTKDEYDEKPDKALCGMSKREFREALDAAAKKHGTMSGGITRDDVTRGYGDVLYRDEYKSREELLNAVEEDAKKADRKVAEMPDIVLRTKGSSQHKRTFRAGGREVAVRKETSVDEIRKWFEEHGISEDPKEGLYDRDDEVLSV